MSKCYFRYIICVFCWLQRYETLCCGKENIFTFAAEKDKIMPDIYTYFGFIFSFYSQEHEPIHVHVEHQDRMTIFDLIIVDGDLVEIKKRHKGKPLTGKDEKTAIEFIEKYWKEIVDKWVSFFVYKKRVRCTDIKTKLK